jgi:hypothetical protein
MINPEELSRFKNHHLKLWITKAAEDGCVDELDQCVDELIRRIEQKELTNNRIQPPISLGEAKDYGLQIGLSLLDVDEFYDHHEARGWISGKSRIVDGRAALRTWKRMKSEFTKRRKFGKQPQRTSEDDEYDTFMAQRASDKQRELKGLT